MKETLAKNIYTVPFYHLKFSQSLERKNQHREVSVIFFQFTFDMIFSF